MSERSTPWRLVVVAGMASYLDAAALVSTGLAVGVFYRRGLGLDEVTVGLAIGLQTVAFAAGALLGGRLGDRVGRRTVLVAALATYVVGVAVLAAASSPSSLVAGVLLTGLAIGADLPSSLALISEEAPAHARGRGVAAAHTLWVLGIAASGLLGLLLAPLGTTAGRLLFVHLVVVGLVVLALRLELRESTEWVRARSGPITGPGPRVLGRTALLAGLAVGAYHVLWGLGASTLGQFRPFLWTEVLGGTARGASALLLLALPIGLVGSVVFVLVVDGPHRHRWVAVGVLLTVAGWVVMAARPSPESFVVLLVLFMVGASVSGEAISHVWCQELVPTLSRAAVQGAVLACGRVASGLLAVGTPSLATAHPHALFLALAGVGLAAAAAAAIVVTRVVPAVHADPGTVEPNPRPDASVG